MYMRFEIAAVSPSRIAFITCGTKLEVDRSPAIDPSTVGSQCSIALSARSAGQHGSAAHKVPAPFLSLRARKD
jgi:hypothetical protein